MNLKLSAWYFLHDKPKFWNDVRRKLHILTLEKSQYYKDCIEFYDSLDVEGNVVIDVGCDFGTTPMYFIRKEAIKVIGFSKDNQYFFDSRYKHFNVDKEPDSLSNVIKDIKNIKQSMDKSIVLKADCEGCEWDFTQDFIEAFDDWIIVVHTPISNDSLYQYIKDHGEYLGNQQGGKGIVQEIGIYRKIQTIPDVRIYKKTQTKELVEFMSMQLETYKLFTRFITEMNHINLEITKKIELINNTLNAMHLNVSENIKAVNEALNQASKEKSEVNEVND